MPCLFGGLGQWTGTWLIGGRGPGDRRQWWRALWKVVLGNRLTCDEVEKIISLHSLTSQGRARVHTLFKQGRG